jgi:hypothetical protein
MAGSGTSRFECTVIATYVSNGRLAFHVLKRDGTVQIVPGPPGIANTYAAAKAWQEAGSDVVKLAFLGPTKPAAGPRFDCPVAIKAKPGGGVELHITKRDGSVYVTDGPPGPMTSDVKAWQDVGSDAIHITVPHA